MASENGRRKRTNPAETSKRPTTRDRVISEEQNVSNWAELTIKLPEIEFDTPPERSFTLFLHEKAFSESFPLIEVQNRENGQRNHRSDDCKCTVSPWPTTSLKKRLSCSRADESCDWRISELVLLDQEFVRPTTRKTFGEKTKLAYAVAREIFLGGKSNSRSCVPM